MTIFRLPDLGEGLPDAEIRQWHVQEGEQVAVDQILVSMETAKAVVEVPAPFSGIVKKLYGVSGDIIETGAPLIEFLEQEKERPDSGTVAGKLEESEETEIETATVFTRKRTNHTQAVKATPAVRAYAKKAGINLEDITATGNNGLLTLEDVKKYESNKKQVINNQLNGELLKGSRRAMADTMTKAHKEIVPVTLFDEVNITSWQEQEDITYRLIKAICEACEKEPRLNSWFDGNSIKLNKEVNLGLATDSKEGLFVPVLANTNKLITNKKDLRQEIENIKTAIKNRNIEQNKLYGATITLSNFGMFAGRYATPIVVPPQVAILGTGKIYEGAVIKEQKIIVGKILPLSLTFDHRAITGGEATRFMKVVIESLSC